MILLNYDQTAIEQIINSLNRLFNITCPDHEVYADYPEVQKSILNMGLPNLSQFNLSNQNDQQLLAKKIEEQIAFFEPRIKDARVEVDQNNQNTKHKQDIATYHFKIHATVMIEGKKHAVAFDSELDPVNEQFLVANEEEDNQHH